MRLLQPLRGAELDELSQSSGSAKTFRRGQGDTDEEIGNDASPERWQDLLCERPNASLAADSGVAHSFFKHLLVYSSSYGPIASIAAFREQGPVITKP